MAVSFWDRRLKVLFLAALTTISKTGSRLPSSTPPTAGTGFARSPCAEKGTNSLSPRCPVIRNTRCSS